MPSPWLYANRFDPIARRLADRHYNRHTIGSPQFAPPGELVALVSLDETAVFAAVRQQFSKHRWPGAWMNSLFRNEGLVRSSDLIRFAVSAVRAVWRDTPEAGIITFVDPRHVRPTRRRGRDVFGYCYDRAGFEHVGFTSDRKLWVWQMTPDRMPALLEAGSQQPLLPFAEASGQ
jgi:hypothetical protein